MDLKKSIYVICSLLLASCGSEGPGFVISGEFEGLKESELLIYNSATGHDVIDTVRVKDGEFVYKGNTNELTSYYLVFPNGMEQVIFVNGGDELLYTAKSNDLRNYVVEGNEENALVRSFHAEVNKLSEFDVRKKAEEYIKANPQSVVSLYVFDRYFVQDEGTDNGKLKELLDVLEAAHPQELSLLSLRGKLSNCDKGLVGSVLPELELETKKGDSINIAGLDSDNTLLFYWASWMPSPYEALDLMREVRGEYGDTELSIVSVSADTKKYRWQEYSRQDSVGIYNCCDQKCWQSPALQELDIRRVPAYVIVGPDKKIVSRSYDVKSLKAELRKHVRK